MCYGIILLIMVAVLTTKVLAIPSTPTELKLVTAHTHFLANETMNEF